MDHFEVYKDLCLFLKRVYYREIYSDKVVNSDSAAETNDANALESLMTLLDEDGQSSDDDETSETSAWRRNPHLKIHSTKMPFFRKNKWLGVCLNLVQEDLEKLDWESIPGDNLTREERRALKDLRQAEQIIIKKRGKGGNVVLHSVDQYEGEVRRLLSDESTYRRSMIPSNLW